jgi:hypothetical protein
VVQCGVYAWTIAGLSVLIFLSIFEGQRFFSESGFKVYLVSHVGVGMALPESSYLSVIS